VITPFRINRDEVVFQSECECESEVEFVPCPVLVELVPRAQRVLSPRPRIEVVVFRVSVRARAKLTLFPLSRERSELVPLTQSQLSRYLTPNSTKRPIHNAKTGIIK
jgi:hypothetical protein